MNEKTQQPKENSTQSTSEAKEENTIEKAEENATEQNADEESDTAIDDPIEALKKQVEEEKNKYLRLYAEFENFRRRNAKERIELIGSASADTIKDILPILDDFSRAIESNASLDDIDSVKQGFELLFQKMTKTLAGKGLKKIESKGEMFDAEIHEAVAQVPVEKAKEKGKIIDEVEVGYSLNDKIIRHPKVVVGS